MRFSLFANEKTIWLARMGFHPPYKCGVVQRSFGWFSLWNSVSSVFSVVQDLGFIFIAPENIN